MDFKNKINYLKTGFYSADTVALCNKLFRFYLLGMFTICMMVAMTQICFAEDLEIFNAAKEMANTIYKAIAGISSVIAGVGIAIAACMYFFSPDERKVASARGWIGRIIIAWVIINCAGLLITTASTLLGSHRTTDLLGLE